MAAGGGSWVLGFLAWRSGAAEEKEAATGRTAREPGGGGGI